MLVITCHVSYAYPGLPWPVHRLTVIGWHGVQLFFMASALTLLLSWQHEAARHSRPDLTSFYIRRYFRIAPAYYLAAALYFVLRPPPNGFDFLQLLASLAFVNTWHPQQMALIPGTWNVVPGGWSIGVEFTFYAIFPIFAAVATSGRRVAAMFAASIGLAVASNLAIHGVLQERYDSVIVTNFLYFWFPNQMPVFVLGAALFLLVRAAGRRPEAPWVVILRRHGNAAPTLAVILFYMVPYLGLPQWIGEGRGFIGAFLVASVPLAAFILALSAGGRSLYVNRWAQALGKVSFSAYLLHFMVIEGILGGSPYFFQTAASGVHAIAAFIAGDLVVIVLTFACAWITYHIIELPMLELGKIIIQARRAKSHRRVRVGGVS